MNYSALITFTNDHMELCSVNFAISRFPFSTLSLSLSLLHSFLRAPPFSRALSFFPLFLSLSLRFPVSHRFPLFLLLLFYNFFLMGGYSRTVCLWMVAARVLRPPHPPLPPGGASIRFFGAAGASFVHVAAFVFVLYCYCVCFGFFRRWSVAKLLLGKLPELGLFWVPGMVAK